MDILVPEGRSIKKIPGKQGRGLNKKDFGQESEVKE